MVFLRRTEACRCKQSLGMWQGTIGETCFIHDDKYTKHSYGVVLIFFFCAALDCPVTPRNQILLAHNFNFGKLGFTPSRKLIGQLTIRK
jgi:hypothetical protein